jgi:branched-chain amino acid transport system ATP-binding protein
MTVMSERTDTALLVTEQLAVGYGDLLVARDIDINLNAGEVIALLGANGAGKTTILRTLMGELRASRGTVRYRGDLLDGSVRSRIRRGVALVPEEKSITMALSVSDNLRLARVSPDAVTRWFPVLAPLMNRRAGLLSGGEQQMLAVGRAMAREPSVLLVDELSLGLAPVVVDRLADALREFADRGRAVLLVEQQLQRALRVSDRFYLLKQGRIVREGNSGDHRGSTDELRKAFFNREALESSPR